MNRIKLNLLIFLSLFYLVFKVVPTFLKAKKEKLKKILSCLHLYVPNLPHEVAILYGFKLQVVKPFHVGYYLPGNGNSEQLCIFAMLSTYSVLPLSKHLDCGGVTGSHTHGGNYR